MGKMITSAGVWDVSSAKEFEVYLHWACATESAGNAFAVDGGEEPLTGIAESTGGYDRFATRRIGRLSLPAGKNRIIVRPDGPLSKVNLFDLRGVYLVPVGVPADQAIAGEPPSNGTDAATAIAKLLDGCGPLASLKSMNAFRVSGSKPLPPGSETAGPAIAASNRLGSTSRGSATRRLASSCHWRRRRQRFEPSWRMA